MPYFVAYNNILLNALPHTNFLFCYFRLLLYFLVYLGSSLPLYLVCLLVVLKPSLLSQDCKRGVQGKGFVTPCLKESGTV